MNPRIDDQLSSLQAQFAKLREGHDFAGALAVARQRSEAAAKHYGTSHVQTAVALNDLAVAFLENRDAASAERTSRDAIAIIEKHAPGEAYFHAFFLATLGSSYEMDGRLKDAEHAFERSLQRFAEVGKLGSPPESAVQRALANVQIQQSSSSMWVSPDEVQIRLPRATREQAEAPTWTGLSDDDQEAGPTASGTGASDPVPVSQPTTTKELKPNAPGDVEIALELTRAELEHVEGRVGPWHPDTLSVVAKLALLKEGTGDVDGAEPLYRRALKGFERIRGMAHADTIQVAFNLAMLLEDKGDASGAEALFRQVLDHGGQSHTEQPLMLATLCRLGALRKEQPDYAGAEPFYRRALEASERLNGNDHEDTLRVAGTLAVVLFQQRSYEAAQPLLRRAIEGYLRLSASTRTVHPSLGQLIACYRFALQKTGHSEAQARAKVNEIARPFGMVLDG